MANNRLEEIARENNCSTASVRCRNCKNWSTADIKCHDGIFTSYCSKKKDYTKAQSRCIYFKISRINFENSIDNAFSM